MKRLLFTLIIIIFMALPATAAGLNLRADEIAGDLDSKQVTATGDIELVIQDQALTGALLEYDWDSQTGIITDFRTVIDGIIITGSTAKVVDDIVYITDANITKCTLPQPELELYTKLLTLELNTKRVTTKGTWIKVFGYKVIPEPSLSFIVDDSRFAQQSREGLPRPIAGVDETRGGYLGFTYQTVPSTEYLFRNTLIYGAKTGLEGDVEYLRRLGDTGTFSAKWQDNPENRYPTGGLRVDFDRPLGVFSLVAAQYQEENEQVLKYLPEFRYSGVTQSVGKLRLTPSLRWGYLESPVNQTAASRIAGQLQASWRHDLAAGFYLDANARAKAIRYGTANGAEQYLEGTHTVYLRKNLANWNLGLGHQQTGVAGRPYFKELDPLSEGRFALMNARYGRNFGIGSYSIGSTVKYDLEAQRFSTATYNLGLTGRMESVALSTSIGLDQDLVSNKLKTATLVGQLNFADKWVLASDLDYNFGQAKWEKGNLSLLRKLHCYDIKLEYDLMERGLGAKVEFTW